MAKNVLQDWRRYPGYSGEMVFCVEHPDYGGLNVFAPSGVAAVIVAADDWGCVWSDRSFFDRCSKICMGHLKSAVEDHG